MRFSLRQVALRIVERAYLSKIERGLLAPPSEAAIIRPATDLSEDPDVLLALAGKLGSDLQAIILRRPKQFAELTRQLKNAPDQALARLPQYSRHTGERLERRQFAAGRVPIVVAVAMFSTWLYERAWSPD